ncbi:hypothetical protein CTI12_AA293850 [Artemisia annua]|uniref:Uncharacterized protein n=1 Tax=Artemisia annua TaxID=35608 RepID=A0A2U1LPG7_ARTAN|nr:hypothetical protein CTI12_AA293850 [Artemisia annua]
MEEPSDLLEDSWFFGNLLDTKPRKHVLKNEDKNSSFKSRKQPPITPSLTRTPSLPTFLMENPNPSPNDQEKAIMKNECKSSHVSSRKQPPVAPPSLTRRPSLPSHDLSRTSSNSSSLSDQEDEEREFSLGRLIRQASMNTSHTSTPPKQTAKAFFEGHICAIFFVRTSHLRISQSPIEDWENETRDDDETLLYQIDEQQALKPLLAQLPDSGGPVDGPVELPSFSMPSFIATDDDPSTIQVATSVLLTGAISVFLFRSLRRRAKRAKQLLVSFIASKVL